MKAFDELGLSDTSLGAIGRLGYEAPTPVQEQAIPLILAKRDVIAAAKTGTGKTAAFSLPALDTLAHAQPGKGPLMLVITPTRELAQQIGKVCTSIAVSTHHRVLTVVGGLAYEPQINRLKHGVDVLIATPGRLVDLMEQQALHLNNITILVLDEADRMLDMGFLPAIKKIVRATPSTRQTLLFSATIDRSIEATSREFLKDPALVEIARRGETADTVEQYIVPIPQSLKFDLLKSVLKERGSKRVIIFTRTRSRADSTCRRLKKAGYTAETIHSDRSQNQRHRALENFAQGKADILVATDVLARGIDVAEVNYVINYDLPSQPEDYIHRIGRTGRAGVAGCALSFTSPETKEELHAIQQLINRTIPELEIKDFDIEKAMSAAAARATRSAARKDPDIAQAAREMAKRERKKACKREESKANKEELRPPRKKKSSPASKTRLQSKQYQSTAESNRKNGKVQQSAKTHKGTIQQQTKSSSQSQKKQQKTPQKLRHATQNVSKTHSTTKKDLRPGRAHRASLAQQRGKQSKKR